MAHQDYFMIAIISSIYLTGLVVFFSMLIKEVIEEEDLELTAGTIALVGWFAVLWFIRLPKYLLTTRD
jgi:hypothetical protein